MGGFSFERFQRAQELNKIFSRATFIKILPSMEIRPIDCKKFDSNININYYIVGNEEF